MTEHQTPIFTGVHLFVRDMAATAAFYRAIGLTVEGDEHFARATGPGGPALVFGSHALTRGYDPSFVPSAGSACALQMALGSREAVDRLHAHLVGAGHRSHLAPFDAFWGSRYAEVLDPDGVVVGFQSPRDPALGGPPPV
jgi:catechol 2,3-dioxygenase-like lactoylglutathione lyase family enzyme